MEKQTVTISPKVIQQESAVFGALVKKIEQEANRRLNESMPFEASLLFASTQLVSPLQDDQEMWLGALLSTMSVMNERKVQFERDGKVETLEFPQWDPDDLSSLSSYPLADIFLNLSAWLEAAKEGERSPERYYGPLFSVAGYILDGIKEGYTTSIPELDARIDAFFDHIFPKEFNEQERSRAFSGQMRQLFELYLQFQKENGIPQA